MLLLQFDVVKLCPLCTQADLGNSAAWENVCGAQNRRGVEVEECRGGRGEEMREGHGTREEAHCGS